MCRFWKKIRGGGEDEEMNSSTVAKVMVTILKDDNGNDDLEAMAWGLLIYRVIEIVFLHSTD